MVLDNIAKHVEDGDLDPLAHGLLRLLAICIEREEDSRIADRARAELARLEEPLRDGRADATRRVKRDLLKCIIREGS